MARQSNKKSTKEMGTMKMSTPEITLHTSELLNKLFNEHILCDTARNREGKMVVYKEYKLNKIFPTEDNQDSQKFAKDLKKIMYPKTVSKKPITKAGVLLKQGEEYWYGELPRNFRTDHCWINHICKDCKLLGSKEGSDIHKCVWANSIMETIQINRHNYVDTGLVIFNMYRSDETTETTKMPEVVKIIHCQNFVKDGAGKKKPTCTNLVKKPEEENPNPPEKDPADRIRELIGGMMN